MSKWQSERQLFAILKALATSSHKTLTTRSLMKRAGYTDLKKFHEDLKTLKKRGLVSFRRSGFLGHRTMHGKLAILNAEPIEVNSEGEFPIEEELTESGTGRIDLAKPNPSILLVEIYGPCGGVSWDTLQDFLKIPNAEREARSTGRVLDLRDGTFLKLKNILQMIETEADHSS